MGVASGGKADDGSIEAADRSDEVSMSSPVLLLASASDIVVVGSGSSSGIIAVVTALSRSIYSDRGRIPVRLHIAAFT